MRALLAFAVLLCSSPALAQDAMIVRKGFTAGLSLGVGAAVVMPKTSAIDRELGLGGLNLEIGGFVSTRFALLLKLATVNYGPFDDRLERGVSVVAGLAGQVWLSDRFNFIAGGG